MVVREHSIVMTAGGEDPNGYYQSSGRVEADGSMYIFMIEGLAICIFLYPDVHVALRIACLRGRVPKYQSMDMKSEIGLKRRLFCKVPHVCILQILGEITTTLANRI